MFDKDCHQGLDSCIVPRTYSITRSMIDCRALFSRIQQDPSQQWLTKATSSFHGKGINLVKNVQEELVQAYGDCRHTDSSSDVVVQRYLRPYLVETGLRTSRPSFSSSLLTEEDLQGIPRKHFTSR